MASNNDDQIAEPVFQSSDKIISREVTLCLRLADINQELLRIKQEYENRMQRVSCKECKRSVSEDWWKRNKDRYEQMWKAHLDCQFELKNHLYLV